DFRELVKDLAAGFHTRIEMRQVGVRDEAKMIGGLGPCGRELCCSGFLSDFEPVTIKMAKEQNLALNPVKISGICGRLMCCLSYEHDMYKGERPERKPKKQDREAGCGGCPGHGKGHHHAPKAPQEAQGGPVQEKVQEKGEGGVVAKGQEKAQGGKTGAREGGRRGGRRGNRGGRGKSGGGDSPRKEGV
ncbi:MAG: regulatory iron-sulfur-containing complex subunit RicT, partial [Deltaproteobacteria bacterium]|nr:regulatory iron-sulfur-containing complex subunit RicT [Deltaproteobacteria bacterium]